MAGQISAPDDFGQMGRRVLRDEQNQLLFSPASLWEIAIKRGLRRKDFQVDPRLLRRGLLSDLHYR